MLLCGIDVGTSGCKAVVYDRRGAAAYAYREYDLIYPAAGQMELDPELVYLKVCECLKECGGKCDFKQIGALAVSSQGEAVIPVDRSGRVLYNAVVTFDSRNEKEYQLFAERTDRLTVMSLTGMPPSPMFSATKLMWFKKARPNLWERVWKLMCFGDFITYRLGAEPAVDDTMAARTMLFDIRNNKWSEEMLSLCGIDEELLPRPVHGGVIIGKVSRGAVKEFGFSENTVIVAGGHDQTCCAIGAGVIRSGCAMDSMGTTESIVTVSSSLEQNEGMARNQIPVYRYPFRELFSYMTFLTASASLNKWYKNLLGEGADFYDRYDHYLKTHDFGPSGLYVLPYFAGAGTPSLDFNAKGMICGLTLDMDSYRIYKSILEAVCYEVKINIGNMESSGIGIEELRCIGGGASSDLWLQMKADITGKPVRCPAIKEAGCLGAAILAGTAVGEFKTPEECFCTYIHNLKTFYPNEKAAKAYEQSFGEYQRIVNNYRMWRTEK